MVRAEQGLLHDLPYYIDVKSRTSIDLAPTILHFLGMKSVSNSFVGRSLFDSYFNGRKGFSALGDSFFMVDSDEVFSNGQISDQSSQLSESQL